MPGFDLPSFDTSGIENALSRMRELTEMPVADSPIQHIWADELFQVLCKYIRDFEKSLDEGHEVGLLLTNFGQSILMQVTEVSYEEPVLMVFKGLVNGQEATLIQHISQLNFLLTSTPKESDRPKRQIGFTTNEH